MAVNALNGGPFPLPQEIESYRNLVFKMTDENILGRRKTNKEVLHLAGVERSLLKTIRKKTNEISWSYKQKRWTRKTCALRENRGKKM